MAQSDQCVRCEHYRMEDDSCKAFPGGIPQEILLGDFDHTRAYPGDNGVRFRERRVVDVADG